MLLKHLKKIWTKLGQLNCKKHNSDIKVEIRKATLERKVIERGSDNELKQILHNYYDHYDNSIARIFSNIEFIKHVTNDNEKMQVLFDTAPCFMRNAFINAWHLVIIDLCSLFERSGTSFDRFLSFVESNGEALFTTTDYYISDFIDEEAAVMAETVELQGYKKLEREDLATVIKSLRQSIDDSAGDIDKIKTVRDKLYAHFDKKMLRLEERNAITKEVSIDIVESLARLAERVLNGIYYYDTFTYFYCKPTNSGDVLGLARACGLYKKYKKEIIQKERCEEKNQIN